MQVSSCAKAQARKTGELAASYQHSQVTRSPKATEIAHIEAREHMNCWRNNVSNLDKELLEGCDIRTTPEGAAISPFQALEMYLCLAEGDECMHEGDDSPSLLSFVDACNLYADRDLKSPILVFSLPEAKRPHQTIMQLAIASYVGPDDGHQLKGLLNTHRMVPAIEKAPTRGVNGKPLRLKTYPDLAQLNTFLGTHGPQCNDYCPFSPATKEEFLLPTFTGAELLTLADCIAMSPVPEGLGFFKHENDIGWDARHLWANALTHPIVHALYLYAKKNLPKHYVRNLVFLYRSVFNVWNKSQKYYEPEAEAIQQPKRGCRGDFKLNCKEVKRVLFLNSFWEKLADIFPNFGKDPDGMCIAHPLLKNGFLCLIRFRGISN